MISLIHNVEKISLDSLEIALADETYGPRKVQQVTLQELNVLEILFVNFVEASPLLSFSLLVIQSKESFTSEETNFSLDDILQRVRGTFSVCGLGIIFLEQLCLNESLKGLGILNLKLSQTKPATKLLSQGLVKELELDSRIDITSRRVCVHVSLRVVLLPWRVVIGKQHVPHVSLLQVMDQFYKLICRVFLVFLVLLLDLLAYPYIVSRLSLKEVVDNVNHEKHDEVKDTLIKRRQEFQVETVHKNRKGKNVREDDEKDQDGPLWHGYHADETLEKQKQNDQARMATVSSNTLNHLRFTI